MSTAFRNFIITFALAAALFAVVGYLAANGVISGLFQGRESVSEDTTEYSYENAESYYDGEYDSSNEDIPTPEEFGDAYVVFYEDHKNELMSAKLLCVNEKSGKLVFESIPLTGTISVNGYNRSLKEIYASNGEKYICGKLQYVMGVTIKGYVLFEPESMLSLFSESELLVKNEMEISCTLPYEVKYEDPEMKEYNEQNPDDIQYITLAGDTVITAENAPAIFGNIPEDVHDSKAASIMFTQIYDAVFNAIFSKSEIMADEESKKEFFECFEKCTIISEEQGVFFSIYDGMHEVVAFPELSSMAGKELNWNVLPSALENAMK